VRDLFSVERLPNSSRDNSFRAPQKIPMTLRGLLEASGQTRPALPRSHSSHQAGSEFQVIIFGQTVSRLRRSHPVSSAEEYRDKVNEAREQAERAWGPMGPNSVMNATMGLDSSPNPGPDRFLISPAPAGLFPGDRLLAEFAPHRVSRVADFGDGRC
jgi:hypothetical protein